MTAKQVQPRFDRNTGQVTWHKRPGWHSWRHQTRDAQDAAREAYHLIRGPEARRRRAAERESARNDENPVRETKEGGE